MWKIVGGDSVCLRCVSTKRIHSESMRWKHRSWVSSVFQLMNSSRRFSFLRNLKRSSSFWMFWRKSNTLFHSSPLGRVSRVYYRLREGLGACGISRHWPESKIWAQSWRGLTTYKKFTSLIGLLSTSIDVVGISWSGSGKDCWRRQYIVLSQSEKRNIYEFSRKHYFQSEWFCARAGTCSRTTR